MADYRARHADLVAKERRNKRAREQALVRLAQRYPQEYEALRLEALREE